jgi:hypothetical protein
LEILGIFMYITLVGVYFNPTISTRAILMREFTVTTLIDMIVTGKIEKFTWVLWQRKFYGFVGE